MNMITRAAAAGARVRSSRGSMIAVRPWLALARSSSPSVLLGVAGGAVVARASAQRLKRRTVAAGVRSLRVAGPWWQRAPAREACLGPPTEQSCF